MLFLSLSIVPLFLLGTYTVISSTKELEKQAINSFVHDIYLRVEKIKVFLRGTESDLLFLSEAPPLQGIIRARQGNGYDEVTNFTYDQWINRLQVIFKSFARKNPRYLQIRYIDETGQEIVRVDSNGATPRIIPKEQLQNKSRRNYFAEAAKLDVNDIHISLLDLNREKGEIEAPYKPVIRYATPIYDASTINRTNDKNRGIVITNVSAEFFLKELDKSLGYLEEETFLIDQNGFYLHHPDKTKEWGGPGNLNTGVSLKQDYSPDLASKILSGRQDQILQVENNIISFQKIFPDIRNKKIFWILMASFPKNLLLQSVTHFRNVLISIVSVVIIISVFISIFYAKLLTSPIHSLIAAARGMAKGDLNSRANVELDDEIGQLASAFNKMADDLKTMINNLNKDIVRRKQAEQELEKANKELKETTAQLIQAEKLTALGELTAGVAHELSQPLNVIKIISQSQLRDVEKGRLEKKDVEKDLPEIVNQVDKMAKIIDHMRIFSRRTNSEESRELFDITKVLENSFNLIEQQLKNHNITLVKELCPDLPQVLGDPISIEHVFLNLLSNARNAVESSAKADKRIAVKTCMIKGEKFVAIEMMDNGSGIPEDMKGKIFQPFFTNMDALAPGGLPVKGKGLGLSVANQIVEGYGGRIEVESEVGKGSTFRVVLPVVED